MSKAQIVLNADREFSFPSGFPPEPGPAGKQTLEGIDSDHDGLRDDVQRWIYARYPKDEAKRKALRQTALTYQHSIRPASEHMSEPEYSSYNDDEDRAIICMMHVFPNDTNSTVESEYVKAKTLNTRERTEQFFKFDAQFDGKTFPDKYEIDDPTVCDK